MKLALVRGNLGVVAVPLLVDLLRREVPPDQVRRPPPAVARPGRRLALLLAPGGQALLAHQRRHGVLAHPPARLPQIRSDPRRPVGTPVRGEQPADLRGQRRPPRRPDRQHAILMLVKPGPGHPQRPAGQRGRNTMLIPLGGDQRGHRYRPIASLTQRATERLSTSRSIASSAFSFRSRASSARSSSPSAPSASPRRRLSAFTQFPRVPSLIPRSLATCAIGRPVSRTSRTAPSLKSRSNFLRVSAIALSFPLRRCVHATRGSPAPVDRDLVAGSCHYRCGDFVPVAVAGGGLVLVTASPL